MSSSYDQKIEQMNQIEVSNTCEMVELWLQYDLYTPRWWAGVALTVLPWIIWFLLRSKTSTYRLLLVGFFVIIITCSFDFVGANFGLWYYKHKVIPFFPTYLPWDTSLFPVIIMLLIQYKPLVHPLLKAIVFSGMSSFVGEPLMAWLDYYVMANWEYFYSFPIYVLIYMTAHWLSQRTQFAPLPRTSKS
ncbi:hypothetical protein DUZ99_03200 [Xylanibacillus composti]|uniref:Uncharacterized protein n=1 Tax=Xylanibacillus composti TaxID=1572762 RepID=A0A8J4H949_9BACL|nr:CBO0543 family protein [Xylanibacillus composti]MDT9724006.1 hypothetical protein [Xylanibacillus composti]GIQ71088.1 hypothetical protein XYCOK13_39120 [Xylanibacillus composti]